MSPDKVTNFGVLGVMGDSEDSSALAADESNPKGGFSLFKRLRAVFISSEKYKLQMCDHVQRFSATSIFDLKLVNNVIPFRGKSVTV